MKVYMLLDRSGSMASLWTEALGSINGYVAELKGDASVFLVAFDTVNPYEVLRESSIEGWRRISSEEIMPRGGTPLNDAAGKLLDKVFRDDPRKAVIVIMTDGEENSSQEYSTAAIKAKINMAKERGYEVVFLGANFDNVEKLAYNYGVASNRVMNTRGVNIYSTMKGLATVSAQYNIADTASAATQSFDSYFTPENKAKASAGQETEVGGNKSN